MNTLLKKCPICDSDANCTYEGLNGYVEGKKFDVYECTKCKVSFVDPLLSDSKLYDYIYEQGDIVPGYERYFRYAKMVEKFKNPLSVLSSLESIYWSVAEALKKYFPNNKKISILEIGSGLGYLTYSLNKSGYTTKGLDISSEAVSKANSRYGNYYESGDLFELASSKRGAYDCVVMTELIEHVEKPADFIKAALSLLKDNGKLIITTPNKSSAPKGTIWQSDVPPVHLWWFSEESISHIAQSLGKTCDFIDFTSYTKKFYENKEPSDIKTLQNYFPIIDKNGKLFSKYEVRPSLKFKYLSVKLKYYINYILRRIKAEAPSKRSMTMCVVIY